MAKTKKNGRIISKAIKHLKGYFNIKEVILFGSSLTGKANRFSDIDLAVISPDFKTKRFEDLATVFAKVSLLCGHGIEFHPYSLDDLKEARPSNFLGHVLETGKVIYKS